MNAAAEPAGASNRIKALIGKVAGGQPLTLEESRAAFDVIMAGDATPAQVGIVSTFRQLTLCGTCHGGLSPLPYSASLRRHSDRAVWFDGYVRTYLERDLQDLSAISALPDFRRLMKAACLRLGQLVNQTELGRDIALPQPTVHRYLNLLEISYLLVRLPAYSVNRTKRLIKSPKLYWGDTGVALHLTEEEPGGAHLENLVLLDLLIWRDARLAHAEVFYWRTTIGEEVDLVVEADRWP